MAQEYLMLQGTVAAVVYQNYDNGYSVLRLRQQDGSAVTVVGTIPLPVPGEHLVVAGKWNTHSAYGKQFEAEFLERFLPQSRQEILAYMSSRTLKGIGPKMAQRIVDAFGEETLAVLEKDPLRLTQVPGISEQKAKQIAEDFRRQAGLRHLMDFFALHRLPSELAVQTYKIYGEQAIDLLYDDPYLLMEVSPEVPFASVDHFAVELGVAGDDPRRIEAALIFELQYNLTVGHSFLPKNKLVTATAQLLTVDEEAVENRLAQLFEAERLHPDRLAGLDIVYLPQLFEAEAYTTRRLLEFAAVHTPTPGNLPALLRSVQRQAQVEYSQEQLEAISVALSTGVLLLTGGPGTGKTTVLRGMLWVFRQLNLKCVLAAPTGRAAKRLSEVTGEEASTIHRLLETTIDPATGQMVFCKDEDDPLKADVVIVDEMSMVDVLLLSALLRAVPPGKRLILVGDPDQLPPVGPGFAFGDCLRSGVLPGVRLTEVFRQAQQSLIVRNAHLVNQGKAPQLRDMTGDFFFSRKNSEEALLREIVSLCAVRLPENRGIPASEIQVLSPTRKGPWGTANLNRLLQNALNPQNGTKRERAFGDYTFREGDRVMQIRNNYDILWKKTDNSQVGAGVFNGDIGIVKSIDPDSETTVVVYDDREVAYEFSQMGELEPAFAMTVHKSQGSEYKAVVLCLYGGSPYLLSRSVLYTAITRARELLVAVGREETVMAMVENGQRNRRYSGLKLRLQGRTGE